MHLVWLLSPVYCAHLLRSGTVVQCSPTVPLELSGKFGHGASMYSNNRPRTQQPGSSGRDWGHEDVTSPVGFKAGWGRIREGHPCAFMGTVLMKRLAMSGQCLESCSYQEEKSPGNSAHCRRSLQYCCWCHWPRRQRRQQSRFLHRPEDTGEIRQDCEL